MAGVPACIFQCFECWEVGGWSRRGFWAYNCAAKKCPPCNQPSSGNLPHGRGLPHLGARVPPTDWLDMGLNRGAQVSTMSSRAPPWEHVCADHNWSENFVGKREGHSRPWTLLFCRRRVRTCWMDGPLGAHALFIVLGWGWRWLRLDCFMSSEMWAFIPGSKKKKRLFD